MPARKSSGKRVAKTDWISVWDDKACESYDKALNENPGDATAWLEKALCLAESGDLKEFGLCLRIINYLKPSRVQAVDQYRQHVLYEGTTEVDSRYTPHILPRDIRLLGMLISKYAVSQKMRNALSAWVEHECANQFPDFPLPEFLDRRRGGGLNSVAVELLYHMMSNKRHRDDRMDAAIALARLGDRSVLSRLIQALKDEDPITRHVVVLALGELGDRSAVPALIEVLRDEDEFVRRESAIALGTLGDRSAVPALVQALKDKDFSVRGFAAEALSELGDRSVIQALRKTLKDRHLKKHIKVRMAIAVALGKLGDKVGIKALVKMLKDEEFRGAVYVPEELGELGDMSAVPVLKQVLLKPKFGMLGMLEGEIRRAVRLRAAKALAKLGDKSAIPGLIDMLRDVDPYDPLFAAEALLKLDEKAAVQALIYLVGD